MRLSCLATALLSSTALALAPTSGMALVASQTGSTSFGVGTISNGLTNQPMFLQKGTWKGVVVVDGPVDTNTVLGRTAGSAASDAINIKSAPFSAKGGSLAGFTDGTVAANSTAFNSQSATFTAADVGKQIVIDGAGASGAPLVTTIASFTDSHNIALATAATLAVPYNRIPGLSLTAAPTITANYSPGATLTGVGGTFSTPVTAKVVYTQVLSASINAAGSGGTASASCVLTGTTGTLYGTTSFQINATLNASGAVSSLGSIITSGAYSANPTNAAAEPVTSSAACGALTGVTLNLVIKPRLTTILNKGVYTALPSFPMSFTSSDSGAGQTASLPVSFNDRTTFGYGPNDTAAFTAAFSAAAARYAAGNPTCVYAPGDTYMVDPSIPTQTGFLCLRGDGPQRTRFLMTPNIAGDLISASQLWKGVGPNATSSPQADNRWSTLKDFSITGYRNSSTTQNAMIFYDTNDMVDVDNIYVGTVRGRALYAGVTKNLAFGYMRESRLNHLKFWQDGDAGLPVFEMNTAGTDDGSNENTSNDIDIYAPYGAGFVARNTGGSSAGTRQLRLSQLRIEGAEQNPAGVADDLMRIGDATNSGSVSNVSCTQCELVSPYAGFAALRIAGASATTGPINTLFDGYILGGTSNYGKGIAIDSARGASLHIHTMSSIDFNLAVGTSANVAGPISIDADNNYSSWTKNYDTSIAGSIYYALPQASSSAGTASVNQIYASIGSTNSGLYAQGVLWLRGLTQTLLGLSGTTVVTQSDIKPDSANVRSLGSTGLPWLAVVTNQLTAIQAESHAISTVTASFTYDATMQMRIADATSAAVVGTLPACTAALVGRDYILTKADTSANAVSFAPNGTDKINGTNASASVGTTQAATLTLRCSGVTSGVTAGWWKH